MKITCKACGGGGDDCKTCNGEGRIEACITAFPEVPATLKPSDDIQPEQGTRAPGLTTRRKK